MLIGELVLGIIWNWEFRQPIVKAIIYTLPADYLYNYFGNPFSLMSILYTYFGGCILGYFLSIMIERKFALVQPERTILFGVSGIIVGSLLAPIIWYAFISIEYFSNEMPSFYDYSFVLILTILIHYLGTGIAIWSFFHQGGKRFLKRKRPFQYLTSETDN
jgi:hypothetical protein